MTGRFPRYLSTVLPLLWLYSVFRSVQTKGGRWGKMYWDAARVHSSDRSLSLIPACDPLTLCWFRPLKRATGASSCAFISSPLISINTSTQSWQGKKPSLVLWLKTNLGALLLHCCSTVQELIMTELSICYQGIETFNLENLDLWVQPLSATARLWLSRQRNNNIGCIPKQNRFSIFFLLLRPNKSNDFLPVNIKVKVILSTISEHLPS